METVKCSKCNRRFFRYSVRRSLKPVVATISTNHVHHGLPYYNYGICTNNHYTKLERDRIEWAPCMKCTKESLRFRKSKIGRQIYSGTYSRPRSVRMRSRKTVQTHRTRSVTR